MIRTRTTQAYCRSCYSINNGKSRPITSRELSENKYRRCRLRRKNTTVKKVVVKSGKGKSKSQPSFE